MKDTRKTRVWTLVSVCTLAFCAAMASKLAMEKRRAEGPVALDATGEVLRDAVAAPPTAGLLGKPVPTTWFKTPASRRAEMDAALNSSRNHRALARRVAVQ